jgi:predicted regulator of Ras-like GTPase activity (Roadblock/LC7/MglB family)
MTFSDVLAEAAKNVEGIIAAGLVGLDGLAVETVLAEGVEGIDQEEVVVELAGLMSSVNRTLSVLKAGKARDLMLDAENMSYLISMIDSGYFLVYILAAGANLGRARFEIRRGAQRLSDTF